MTAQEILDGLIELQKGVREARYSPETPESDRLVLGRMEGDIDAAATLCEVLVRQQGKRDER